MTHSKQPVDVIGLVARWAGFILLISLFFPAVHKPIAAFGLVAVGLSVLVVIALVGFGIYRLTIEAVEKKKENPFATSANEVQESRPVENESRDTVSMFRPALRRRYPWRHKVVDPF